MFKKVEFVGIICDSRILIVFPVRDSGQRSACKKYSELYKLT